ncbi:DUF4276 family protein [Pseudodesulfovibrio pelocollis]|uniref:DUF4276 family protein n=1 Tax=Pseudodesulfovibrio pelocollis TaxID=3051432 RepID=UPI00255AD050|nr:DUF4276 family protein [Pseudodesulfovibrio sp. SB368]
MITLVFFLEEPSAKEMLSSLLPRILPEGVSLEFRVFNGKQDLDKNLTPKLRGWLRPNCVFVVMRDQDLGDCKAIKSKLARLCLDAGRNDVLIRIACRELESFYLGDLHAVEKGLGLKGIGKRQRQAKFRNPDKLQHPSEELDRLTDNRYAKMSGSRAIAPYLDPETNLSSSFKVLVSGILALCNNKQE